MADVRDAFVNYNRWHDYQAVPCKHCLGKDATTFNTVFPGINGRGVATFWAIDQKTGDKLYGCFTCNQDTIIPVRPRLQVK